MDTRNSLVCLRSCLKWFPGGARSPQWKQVVVINLRSCGWKWKQTWEMHQRTAGERSPALVRSGEISKEPKGKLKRESALIACQAKGSVVTVYNNICLLPLLLPPHPALEGSEAEMHGVVRTEKELTTAIIPTAADLSQRRGEATDEAWSLGDYSDLIISVIDPGLSERQK